MDPALIVFLPPVALAAAALAVLARPGRDGASAARLCDRAGLAALAAAALALGALVWSGVAGGDGAGFGPRLDAVSGALLALIAFVGWAALRYAAVYLRAAPRQADFMGWMAATIAAAMILVTSADLAQLAVGWIATSLALHKLLLFHPDRPGARRAARKKMVMARLGDAALIGAIALIASGYGTIDLGAILGAARAGEAPAGVAWAALLIAVSALLKSAQFPTHGWLVEVMETPTPVSALLHAGIVNAGGFLMIRFADLLLLAPGVLALVALVGGFTALFGGLVMLTQPAAKTQLAWSTVAQMGFMTLQCGLALFPLALLHILAHSLYKAHAFLAAGGAVEAVAALRRPGPVAVPSPAAVGRAFLLALGVYALAGAAVGFGAKTPQEIVLGAILVLGVAYLLAQGLADAAPAELTWRVAALSGAAAVGYFALQAAATRLTSGALPPTPAPGPLEGFVLALTVLGFAAVAAAQAMLPLWAGHPAAAGLRTHLANGFYANALFDRLIGGWKAARSA